MPEFIPRRNLPEGLAALVAQLQAKQGPSLAAGITSAVDSISRGFSDRFDAKAKIDSAALSTKTAADLAAKSNYADVMKGLIAQGIVPFTNTDQIAGMLEGKASLPVGPGKKDIEKDKDSMTITKEMIANFPQFVKMGFTEGHKIPVSVFNANTKMEKPAKDAGLTEAQKIVDKEFAKEYADFNIGGGYADVQKQLDQLRGVVSTLQGKGTAEKPKGINATGSFKGLLPKVMRDSIDPAGSALQDQVEEVVQRNLRIVLGAQYTEKEGAALIARAYNPRQTEAENISRLNRLITQIDTAAKAKAEAGAYYEKNGSLVGFTGKLYRSANDFLGDAEKKGPKTAGAAAPGAPKADPLDDLINKHIGG